MNHLDFIVWVIGFPISQAIIDAIRWNYCERRVYSDGARGIAALTLTVIWIAVGGMLW